MEGRGQHTGNKPASNDLTQGISRSLNDDPNGTKDPCEEHGFGPTQAIADEDAREGSETRADLEDGYHKTC